MTDEKEPTKEERIDAMARAHYHAGVLNAKPFDLISAHAQQMNRNMAAELLNELRRTGWQLARIEQPS